jgi:hypothetical protein
MLMPADPQQMQVVRDEVGHFVKGQSGNPSGRAAGTRNRATVLAEQLFDGAAAALANKAVAMALAGDAAALKLCIGRIIAPRRQRPTSFALPPLRSAADLAPAVAAIAEAAAEGAISTGAARLRSRRARGPSAAARKRQWHRRRIGRAGPGSPGGWPA